MKILSDAQLKVDEKGMMNISMIWNQLATQSHMWFPLTNLSLQKWCLEDVGSPFSIWNGPFSGDMIDFQSDIWDTYIYHENLYLWPTKHQALVAAWPCINRHTLCSECGWRIGSMLRGWRSTGWWCGSSCSLFRVPWMWNPGSLMWSCSSWGMWIVNGEMQRD